MAEMVLRKIQYGLESIKGTAVAATKLMLGAPMVINPDRKPVYPQDMAGVRARSTRSQIYAYLVRNSLKFDDAHPLYYQILPMLFSCGLKGSVTPTETTGGQGDWLWNFTPSLTAANVPQSITLEAGDDVQEYESEYVMFERLRFGGTVAQDGGASPVNADADFFGRQWTASTFTGALSIPSTEIANAGQARFYRNVSWATVGNTEVAGILRGFDIEILTGIHPKFFGSANKYFSGYGESYIDVMANFTFEGNSDANAIWALMNTQALSVVRLKVEGSQIGSGTNYMLQIDIGGTWESVIPLSAEDRGNNIHAAVLHGRYDATGAKLLQVSVTTNNQTV